MEKKEARAVVYSSANGRNGWLPVPPEFVPDWVKDPITMGRLMAGEMCVDCGEGDRGSLWYMVKRVAYH